MGTGASPHGLSHTFGAALPSSGGDPEDVQGMDGDFQVPLILERTGTPS